MALTVCTGMWGEAYEKYGRRFFESFDAMWPEEVALHVWSDRQLPLDPKGERDVRNLRMGGTVGWTEFISAHIGDPEKCGRQPREGWKDKDRAAGYSFRFDACRFAGQSFIPEASAAMLEDGHTLAWFDADMVTHAAAPVGWIESLVADFDGAYLGRGRKHSEIGFWAVRLNDGTRQLLYDFAELYRSGEIWSLRQWHSAFVWDEARRRLETNGAIKLRDLTPGGEGHVWFQSPLKAYTDHLKGPSRKAAGRSPERR